MARAVENAPTFNFEDLGKIPNVAQYFAKYDVTDDQGRYLHWNQLKWRVSKKDAHNIWTVIKFKRASQMTKLPLYGEDGKQFAYCTPSSLEAMLHQVVRLAGGNVGAIDQSKASDSLQNRFLVSSLLMEEAITSAQLEGAATTREVAKKMLEEDREPEDEDERMILNNYLLLKYAEQNKDEQLTVDLILEFHRIATLGTTENDVNPGEFRTNNDIYVGDGSGGVAHQPPDYNLLPERMNNICEFANADHSGQKGGLFIAPVVKAVILHFMIGYEHAFRDGNGRTARALFYWYMLRNEYDLFKYVSISKLLKEKPRDYGISFLYTEKDENDLTYFLYFQLTIILDAFDELKNYLDNKAKEFQQTAQLLERSELGKGLTFIQKDLIKKAVKEPGKLFTVKGVSASYSIAANTARSHLKKLVKLKLFLESKDGKTAIFFAPSDLADKFSIKET